MKRVLFILLLSFFITTSIADNFKYRGFHVDLRHEVMTIGALKQFATTLAGMNINTILMEYEATFPYQKHATICSKDAYSRADISDFVAHCKGLEIEVIPMQQNFGHVEYILRHDRYNSLSENRADISQVCPLKDSACMVLFDELFSDLMSLHDSQFFHIGGDETYLLGQCKDCSAKALKDGKSKLFVDYMKQICDLVIRHGKTPVMWADIILKYPEAIDQLPKQTIFVDWNYGWAIDHFGDVESLIKKGAKFWGAPAIRSSPDDRYVTAWSKHFENQRDFIPHCRKLGYQGIIMTSWSTSGVYSTIWDQNNEVVDMRSLRDVYPMSGFNILINLYSKAIAQDAPIDIKGYVAWYAQDRLGLTLAQGEILYNVLMTKQAAFANGKPLVAATLEEIVAQCDDAIDKLSTFRPKRNSVEIDHLILMFRIRKNHTQFKHIESQYQSELFVRGMAKDLRDQLRVTLRDCVALDRDFIDLNGDYISPRQLDEINRFHRSKMEFTLARLESLCND